MRIQKGKHVTLKSLNEDLYLETNSQLHPEELDATMDIYGIIEAEDHVIIHGSVKCSEASFGNNCHVKGSVITGGIKTGSKFKAHHVIAGEGAKIGDNSEIAKLEVVDDVVIGKNSKIKHAISERGHITLSKGAEVDVIEAEQGVIRA
jgi:ADP-glucose pyrophosphorylase